MIQSSILGSRLLLGGGQPKPNGKGQPDDKLRKKRIDALYSKDEKQTIRSSADNPEVKSLYEDFLGQPLSPLAHELFHTSIAAGNK